MAPSNTLLLRLLVVVTVFLPFAAGRTQAQLVDSPLEGTPTLTAFPEYPAAARLDRLEGEATVCFTIDSEGGVNRPRIRSSTDKIFEKPTLKAIRESTFQPLEAGQVEALRPVCRTYRYLLDQLDPLYVANDSITPPAPLAGSAASLVASAPNTDPLPPIEQGGLAPEGADADASIAADTLTTSASPLPPEEPICTTRKRPGTRIDYKFCYTPEQQVMVREAKERAFHDLQQEGRWRDQAIQEAQMENRYPTGAGMGPSH